MAGNIVHIEPYWYNEKDILGEGAFGQVYKGHHDQNKSMVLAIKRIWKGKLPQKIIDQEIQIMQELSKPDIQQDHFVTLVDCVQTDIYVYLVMEYCNGKDLDHYLEANRKLDERNLKIFLQQMASGLKILHDLGIVHRDLKPANILLTTRSRFTDVSNTTFKIADFGLGRFLDEGAQAGTYCGTRIYMAPEVRLRAKYNYKADLFSIGVIAYQCYYGSGWQSSIETKPLKICIPVHTSPELADLITRLLCSDQKYRINFHDFYNHPFLGMKEVDEQKRKSAKPAGKATPAAGDPQSPTENNPQNPTQKNIPQYTAEVNPRRALSPAAKDGAGVKRPVQKDAGGPTAQPSPRNREFVAAILRPFRHPPNAIRDGAGDKRPVQKDAKGPKAPPSPMNRREFVAAAFIRPYCHPLNVILGAAQNLTQRNIPQYNPRRALLPAAKEALSTQLIESLVLKNRDVCGVAYLHLMFYILAKSPNAIACYSGQSSFMQIKDLDITEHIKHPQDIASSEASKCLYVTDIGNNCIWKVEHTHTFKLARWVSDVSSPHTLSVGPEGRVVTFGNQSKSLDVYGSDAVLIHRIPLPSEVNAPQHAVKTSKGHYVVSYGELNGKKQGICEINRKGKVYCRYEHKTEKLNHPTYLAIDTEDNVYVVDTAHSRILQLDSLLKLEQILPSDERNKLDKPFRLCLKSIKGQRRLLVEHRRNRVNIYSLTQG